MSVSRVNNAVFVNDFAADLSNVRYGPVSFPELYPGGVLIKVLVRPINPADVLSAQGFYAGFKPKTFPAVLGLEGVGEVEDPNGSQLIKGQRVIVFFDAKNGNGSWQEYVVRPVESLIPVPDSVSTEAASQFLVNPGTVLGFLDELQIPQGKYLVQSAAGSVLGRQLIQLAKYKGIKTVNLVRRKEQIEELKAIGADVVLWTEEPNVDLGAAIREATGGEGAYAGVDAVGGSLTGHLQAGLRDNGVLLVYGALSGITFEGRVLEVLTRNVQIRGFWLNKWLEKKNVAEVFGELIQLLAEKVIVPYNGEKFELSQIKEALSNALKLARGGKTLLVSK